MNAYPTSRPFTRRARLAFLFRLTAALLCLCADAFAQGATPERGFQPNGSYTQTDIETVSLSSGNMMLRVPVGSLPDGRGGHPGYDVSLLYNSKLWNTIREVHYNPFEGYNYSLSILQPSDDGGWRYGTGYTLRQYNRADEYVGPYNPECNSQESVYHWKVKMRFPDGGEREFRPLNFGQSPMLNDGYYAVDLNGFQTNFGCSGSWANTSGMTYYSIDGSYARLEVDHDWDHYWWNNTWTLYLPDGTRVTGGGATQQRIYDSNNNYVEFRSVTLPNGQPATQLVDQLGRAITFESDWNTLTDYISVSGFGGEEVRTTVRWREVYVYNRYRATMELLPQGHDPHRTVLASMLVVGEVVTPPQGGSLNYVFDYDASATWPSAYTNNWGDLTYLKLPTGAEARYQYSVPDPVLFTPEDVLRISPTRKDLTYRQEYDGVPVSNSPCASNCVTETWQYAISPIAGSVESPDGGLLTEQFFPSDPAFGYTPEWMRGKVYKTMNPDGSVVERLWQTNAAYGTSAWNPYVKTEFRSVRDAQGNLVKTEITDYSYDKNGNVTQRREYDWVAYGSVPRDSSGRPTGVPFGAPLLRLTTNTVYNPTPDASNTSTLDFDVYVYRTGRRLWQLVESSEVSDGAGRVLSRTESFYDDPNQTGNLTLERSWDSSKGGLSRPLSTSNSVSESTQYDAYGNEILETDEGGSQTHYTYGPVGGHTSLYPTEERTAYGTSVQRTTLREYDFHTGLVTRSTDADNQIADSTAYDVFGRATLVREAEGRPEESRTSTTYSDVMRRVITRDDLTNVGDGRLVTVKHYDQLGRIRLSRQLEDSATQSAEDEAAGIKVQTRYLFSGGFNYVLVSQPYRAATPGGAGEQTRGWKRTKQDRGGRVVEVQTFQGAALPAPWGANSSGSGAVVTSYDAEFTTVTDQAGKVRRTRADALGRLARVDEPNAGGDLGHKDAPAQPTTYTYDALGNLRVIEQGVQRRHFMYSSLSRLLRAMSPEHSANQSLAVYDPVSNNSQWSVGYAYDDGGNLLTKTDARGVSIGYTYDALDRNVTVDYSDTAINPDIRRYYDGATNGKGLFWHDYAGGDYYNGANVEHRAVDAYDAHGRPLTRRVLFKTGGVWGQNFTVQRAYDRAGNVVSQTYPSGRTVTYGYDAAGRLNDFRGTLGDGSTRVYSTGVAYDEQGRRKQEQFGTATPVYHKRYFNNSGQISEIRDGTTPNDTGWNRGAIINHYSHQSWAGTGTDNNGNLRKQDVYIPNDDAVSGYSLTTFFYDYDSLNRLDLAREVVNGANTWVQDYQYDRYGNRTVYEPGSWGGVPEPQFEVETATNRLYAPGDSGRAPEQKLMRYDAAGNLAFDAYSNYGQRTFDAENRMTSARDVYGLTSSYSYDADGHRVRRRVAGGAETWHVYGMDGELLAEYAQSAAPSSPRKEYGYRAGELLVTAAPAAQGTSGKITPAGVTASGTYLSYAPANATDGNTATEWISGGFPTQWIQLDLGQTFGLSKVRLLVSQSPAGNTTHQIWCGPSPSQLTLAGTISQYTQAGQWLELALAGNARYVHVVTTGSPSWVAWGEVEVYGTTQSAGTDVRWLVPDQLGTPRMVLDQTGSLSAVSRHDYLPFGEEIGVGMSGRTSAQGYGRADGVRQQFTSKERDGETGLDYFLARFYSAVQGRFISPDEFNGGPEDLYDFVEDAADNPTIYADLDEPQSLNKYVYCLNNPLAYIDPDGHKGWKEWARAAVEVATYVPGPVGMVASGVQAIDKIAQGDYKGAAMSAVGAIPGVKIVKGIAKAADAVSTVSKATRATSNFARAANTGNNVVRSGTKTFQTYTKTHPKTGKVYVGRTSGTGTPRENVARRDRSHHRNKDGFGPAKLDKSSSKKNAIRGREQQMIDHHKRRGTGADQINGISPRNKKRDTYMDAAEQEFGKKQ